MAVSVTLWAQRHTYREYDSADGLTDLTVHCLLQDRQGYIWVGTDNGLFRYDGSRFIAFHDEDGLPDSTVRAIAESPEGAIWVATRSGIARSSGGHFEAIDVGETGVFRAVAFDRFGRVYLEARSGIIRGVPGGGGSYQFQMVARGSIGGLSVHGDDVRFGRDGDLWRLTGETAVRIGSPAGLPADRWSSVIQDFLGNLWVGSVTHLYELPHGQTRFVDRSTAIPLGSLSRLYADSHGRVFVSGDGGVEVLDGDERTRLDPAHGLPVDGVGPVLLDREGSLWLGAQGRGLIRELGRGDWLDWKMEDGLLNNTVWAVLRDRAGQTWVGTNGGLNLIDPQGKVTHSWTSRNGLGGDEVYAIAEGLGGEIYVSTYPNGISRLSERGEFVTSYRSPSALATGWILAMTVDRQGRLWTAGSAGCFRSRMPIDAGRPDFDRVEIPGAAAGSGCYDAIAHGDEIWIGSPGGVARFANGQWRLFTKRDGLKASAVGVVARGPDGIWVAYDDALGVTHLQLDGDRIEVKHFTRKDGLASDRVFGLAFDASGRLWATSDAGVDVLETGGAGADGAQAHWRHYGREDGLIWNDADSYALSAGRDGDMWIGTSSGLSRYSPPRFPLAETAPPVVITSMETSSHAWESSDRPALPFAERSLFLRYSGLSYAFETSLRFRYRLLGFNSRWTETRERSVRFEGLPAGDYRFQVEAAGPNGLWTPAPAEFDFSIVPPWWQSWWFRAACVGAAVLLVSALWRLRVRVLMAQQRLLERLVADRTSDLTESHRQLEEMAYCDTLTLLPNRRRFSQRFRARLEAARTTNERFALLLIDLDRFKQINDTYGHDAGDCVLVETAQRLRAAVRDSDCVARLGGDEFAILLFANDERVSIDEICERIVGDSTAGIPCNGQLLHASSSIGVAIYPDDGESESSLYKAADVALYDAKRIRSSFCFRSRLHTIHGPQTGGGASSAAEIHTEL